MDKIITILGSTVIGAIITAFFNWAQNRKNVSLSYITEERKVWREKIRDISFDIEQCTYQEKKKIEQCLVQLQMNINPYGKTNITDYLCDGHIWETIREIECSKDAEEFEKNKKLLLDYFALMLKEDWERSKREVRGYSKMKVHVGMLGWFGILYAIFYFYVLKLENYMLFFMVFLMNVLVLFLLESYFFDEMSSITDNLKNLAIKSILKNDKKKKKVLIVYVLASFLYFVFNIFIVQYSYPKMVAEEIEFFESEQNVYIATKLDEKIWVDLEKNIEFQNEKDLVWVENEKQIPEDAIKLVEVDSEMLREVVSDNMQLWCFLIFLWTVMFWGVELKYYSEITNKERRFIAEVERLKCDKYESSEWNYKEMLSVLDRLDFETGNRKENAEYLGLIYKICCGKKRSLEKKICEKENNIMSIKTYDAIKKLKNKIEDINEILKNVEVMARRIKTKTKKQILSQVKNDIKKLCE